MVSGDGRWEMGEYKDEDEDEGGWEPTKARDIENRLCFRLLENVMNTRSYCTMI
jgi:hypothetical protein